MYRKLLFAGMLVLSLSTCKQGIDKETYTKFQTRGNEVTNLAQGTLLAKVGSAIQQGGPEYAVEFCNLKAGNIVDSLNQVYNCTISRVSEKNRNPENELKDKIDEDIWRAFSTNNQSDTLLVGKNNFVYYKRINTAMPACLKCHGNPETDITAATKEKLMTLYPNDLAVGYKLNEFRGLWKVEFMP
ncbi:Tll0287-like domain-containing protein [Maribellus sediminis]|uniref:Tll0287-like domain-containing protein n=1 Tax=Maribellus sediminis TaxID=2696285 RepID=UPI0014309106|nr:DUF3365 domain-containing protein [Maribellus sediminis]